MNDVAKEMRDLADEPIITAPEGRSLLRIGAAEIERLRAALSELAEGFERARDASPYMAEAQRLNNCAKFCRDTAVKRS